MSDSHQVAAVTVPWRAGVRALAEQRADLEERARWSCEPPFRYRWEHVQAVVSLALRLAAELGADAEVVEAAAWLHDIAKGDAGHAASAAAEAPAILAQTDFPAHKIAAVAQAIALHAGFVKHHTVEPLEAAVLWDADKLTKLGATAVALSIGLGLSFPDGRTLADMVRANGAWSDSAGIVASMNTEPGRRLAEARQVVSEGFWRTLGEELEHDQ